MDTAAELSSARAALAGELIDSLDDGELASGKVRALSFEKFLAGLRRPARSVPEN